MLTKDDIRGVVALPSTPTKPGCGGWDATNAVDLDSAASLVEKLIASGVAAIGVAGTTGECAALLAEEKRALAATVVDTARKRVPVIAGATELGTREVVRQMRGLKDAGVDAALIGLPLWQTPTLENMVQFYAELGEAVPDLPIMVYANSMFFKSNFPTQFWAAAAQNCPTVIMCKVSYGVEHIVQDLDAAGHMINFVVGEGGLYEAYRKAGTRFHAAWATSANMGPEPVIALFEAMQKDDRARVEEIYADFKALPPTFPDGLEFRQEFPKYNAQVNKFLGNHAGYHQFGPSLTPYRDLPDRYQQQLLKVAEARKALREKYTKVAAS
jgi:trans-o-hydroxybenzylidenepyruvate hydratase-aldolase